MRYGLAAPDAIVSGIPFATIARGTGLRIIETIAAVLAPGGRFVAYRLSTQVDQLSRRLLGRPYVEVALLNVPPLHLYRWQKHDGLRAVTVDRSRDTSVTWG